MCNKEQRKSNSYLTELGFVYKSSSTLPKVTKPPQTPTWQKPSEALLPLLYLARNGGPAGCQIPARGQGGGQSAQADLPHRPACLFAPKPCSRRKQRPHARGASRRDRHLPLPRTRSAANRLVTVHHLIIDGPLAALLSKRLPRTEP